MDPHEGLSKRDPALDKKYIYSSEDPLYVTIAKDDYLHLLYIGQLRQILLTLTPIKIKNEIETIYAELLPYYNDPKTIAMNKYDWFNDASLETLETKMNTMFYNLVTLRNQLLTDTQ